MCKVKWLALSDEPIENNQTTHMQFPSALQSFITSFILLFCFYQMLLFFWFIHYSQTALKSDYTTCPEPNNPKS